MTTRSLSVREIGLTATRRGLTPQQKEWFGKFMETLSCPTFRHGDCVGGDADLHAIIEQRRSDEPEYDACISIHPCTLKAQRAFCAWTQSMGDRTHPPRPPLERNRNIVAASEILVAFPGGMAEELRSGTWAAVRYARRVGKPTVVCWPDGSTTWTLMPKKGRLP